MTDFCNLQQCRNYGCSSLKRDKDVCTKVKPPRKPSEVRRGIECDMQQPRWGVKDCREKGCTCEKCVEMCQTYPCMPLPEEAQKLIGAGYGDRMMLDTIAMSPDGVRRKILALRPAMVGHEHDLAPMEIGKSPCVFFRDERCGLHASGLKPYEGRFCRHDSTKEDEQVMMATLFVAWDTWYGQTVARLWVQQFYTGDPKWTDPKVLAGEAA